MDSALQKVESSEHEVMQFPAMMTYTEIPSFSSESPWQCENRWLKRC